MYQETQNMGKETENSYQKMKRFLEERPQKHTETNLNYFDDHRCLPGVPDKKLTRQH